MTIRPWAALPALALVLVACGGTDAAPERSTPPQETWAVTNCAAMGAPATAGEPPAGSAVEDGVSTTAVVGEAPLVGVSGSAQPAAALVTLDVVEGSGDPVQPGATVTVDYCGVGLATRAMFDSSWTRGTPATFPLDGVIPGWTQGIPGMKPGGRRLLIIPGDLAYGPNPPPQSGIEPDETLVFVVDLISSP
ncbi:MAG: FKBP-type peptidyl-prolyl cis-trans isomerase [bacterium]